MKHIIIALVTTLLLLSSSLSFGLSGDGVRTDVVCEEGYKFLIIYASYGDAAPSVIQIYEDVTDKKFGIDYHAVPQPMKCK